MVFLFEEIVVEGAAIIATIARGIDSHPGARGFRTRVPRGALAASRSGFASQEPRPERAAPAQRALAHRG